MLDQMFDNLRKASESSLQMQQEMFKTPDDYRHTVEELLRKMFTVFKDQSETQLRGFQKGVEELLEIVPKAKA